MHWHFYAHIQASSTADVFPLVYPEPIARGAPFSSQSFSHSSSSKSTRYAPEGSVHSTGSVNPSGTTEPFSDPPALRERRLKRLGLVPPFSIQSLRESSHFARGLPQGKLDKNDQIIKRNQIKMVNSVDSLTGSKLIIFHQGDGENEIGTIFSSTKNYISLTDGKVLILDPTGDVEITNLSRPIRARIEGTIA